MTGSNTGIGVPTALALAKTGARVVFACRTREKALRAMDGVVEASKGKVAREKLSFLPLDLSSLLSTKVFVHAFLGAQARDAWGPLSLLVCNAGIFNASGGYEETVDGFEKAFQVNFLANVVLVKGLMPALRVGIAAGQSGRVVFVSR